MGEWQVIWELGSEWERQVEACRNADFYHRASYVGSMIDSPEVKPALVVFQRGASRVVHPILFRPLTQVHPELSGSWDVVSCYGYGGPAWSISEPEAAAELLLEFWKGEAPLLEGLGVVSEFVRLHPLIPESVPPGVDCQAIERGWTVEIDLERTPEEMRAAIDTNHERKIRAAHKAGVRVVFHADPGRLGAFTPLYHATMNRLGAHASYLYPEAALRKLFEGPAGSAWIGEAFLGDDLVAANLYLAGESFFHYHLGSSNDAARACGANHLLMFESLLFARSLSKKRVHLGGGVGCADDGLLRYKEGFGGSRRMFSTAQRILRPAEYKRALQVTGMTDTQTAFFPKYRYRPDPSV